MSEKVCHPRIGAGDRSWIDAGALIKLLDFEVVELLVIIALGRDALGVLPNPSRIDFPGTLPPLSPFFPYGLHFGLSVPYLDDPPDADTLRALVSKLGIGPRDLLRTGEEEYRSLGLADEAIGAVLFVELADGVDDDTWEYHRAAGDYSAWFRAAIKDDSLAEEAAQIENDAALDARQSREKIAAASDDGGAFRDLALKVRTKDGVVLEINVSGGKIELDNQQVLLSMFTDTTANLRSQEELMRAIAEVMSDTAWFGRSVVDRLAKVRAGSYLPRGAVELTKREEEVLSRMAKGLSNDEICAEFGIAHKTVSNHVTNIYQKLGVNSRSNAVIWAREHGFMA